MSFFEWETATPKSQGLDFFKLKQARDYALTGGGSGCIARGGKLVMAWGDQEKRYDIKSSTKSIGVTPLGLAIKDGLVKLDDKACTYVEEMDVGPNAGDGRVNDITLRHLATMTAGFEKPGGFEKLVFDPGTRWAYTDGGANWLADCLTIAFNQDMKTLMFERVFEPLGISESDLTWRKNAYRRETIQGITRCEFGAGIHANVDALAKIGYLYLNRGRVNNLEILSEFFLILCVSPFLALKVFPWRTGRRGDRWVLQVTMVCCGGTMQMGQLKECREMLIGLLGCTTVSFW